MYPSDPILYAKCLRTGNVIEIGMNRYEVKGGTFEAGDNNVAISEDNPPTFVIELELISVVTPEGAQAPKSLKATLKVDPYTIIPFLE